MKTVKYLFEYQGKKYFYEDILDVLGKIGIERNDRLFVHSDLKLFGKINPQITKEEYIDAFIQALMDLVGENGTLIVPTFSYSFCKGDIYDPENTPSDVGILTERFRKINSVVRTLDPIFSTTIWGNKKEYYKDIGTDCFGENSIFQKIYIDDFKIVFIGNTFDITYMHFIEQDYKVPYRYIKKFKGKVVINGELKECTFSYNVRPLDSDIDYDLNKISNFLDSKCVLKKSDLGYSLVRLVTAVDAYNKITEEFKGNIRILLKEQKTIAPIYDAVHKI